MDGVSLTVLGSFRAERDGTDIPLGGPRQRAVLAVLLCARGAVVSADRLVSALWDDHDQLASPLASLQAYVSNLRRALEPDRTPRSPASVLVSVPPGYALRLDDDAVDLWRFEKAVFAARPLPAQRRRQHLEAALRMWNGPALAEFDGYGWAAAEAERSFEVRESAREMLIESLLDEGDAAGAALEAASLVKDAPLRDRAWYLLALSRYLAGRQSDALATLREARELFAGELGLDPAPALFELERAVLNNEVLAPSFAPATIAAVGAPVTDDRNADDENTDDQKTDADADQPPLPVAPTPTTPFIGRDAELAYLAELVGRQDVRLITITGPGGSGKTRLAAEYAHRPGGTFDAIFFVALQSALTDEDMLRTLAAALTPPRSGTARRDIQLSLAKQGRVLLILDNLEQVTGAALVISHLLSDLPQLTVLTTSRNTLLVGGEWVYQLDPLELPDGDDADAVRASAAGQLFVATAQRVRAGFTLDETNAAEVAAICRRLDGLPLAIELAAVQLRVFAPRLVLDRLTSKLGHGFTAADRPPRHRTIGDTIAWSYELLDPGAQQVLRWLAVFRGRFDTEAVEGVLVDNEHAADDTVDAVTRLISANLVQLTDDDDILNLGLLETVRAYAAELLDADPTADTVRLQHLYWCESVKGRAVREIYSAEPRHLHTWTVDARAALEWATTTANLPVEAHDRVGQLAEHLARVWLRFGSPPDAAPLLSRLLAVIGDSHVPGTVMLNRMLARYALFRGAPSELLDYAQDALAIARELGGEPLMHAWETMAMAYGEAGMLERAEQAAATAVAMARQCEDAFTAALVTGNVALFYLSKGHYREAFELAADAELLATRAELPLLAQMTSIATARAQLCLGDVTGAARRVQEWTRGVRPTDPMTTREQLDVAGTLAAHVEATDLAQRAFGYVDEVDAGTNNRSFRTLDLVRPEFAAKLRAVGAGSPAPDAELERLQAQDPDAYVRAVLAAVAAASLARSGEAGSDGP